MNSLTYVAIEALQNRSVIHKGRNRRDLNRVNAVQDRREFFDILKCRAANAGIPFLEVSPAGMSGRCLRHGTRVTAAPSKQIHRCGAYGASNWIADCDKGADRNTLSRGLHMPRGRSKGLDGTRRSSGFRETSYATAEDPPHRRCAIWQAVPGNRTAMSELGNTGFVECRSLPTKS